MTEVRCGVADWFWWNWARFRGQGFASSAVEVGCVFGCFGDFWVLVESGAI